MQAAKTINIDSQVSGSEIAYLLHHPLKPTEVKASTTDTFSGAWSSEYAGPATRGWSQPVYDTYSFKVLPWLGEKIAQDSESYRYLAESIRMHPDAQTLKEMMLNVGFDEVETHRMTGGIVALHIGIKY